MSDMHNKPCILCCAITGSVPTKVANPAVPISISEQVESSLAAVEAGASIIHAHVRNADETPSSDPEKFAVPFLAPEPEHVLHGVLRLSVICLSTPV